MQTIGAPIVDVRWRGPFTDQEVNALHAEGFDHHLLDVDWTRQVEQWSVGWVTARTEVAEGAALLGFVNVAGDGDVHAFVLDTIVTASARRQGVGRQLIEVATQGARAAGCEWLHVDFEPHLRGFYLEACGFKPTDAGLIALR